MKIATWFGKTAVLLAVLFLSLLPALAQQPAGTAARSFDAAYAAPYLSGVGTAILTWSAGKIYDAGHVNAIVTGTTTSLTASYAVCDAADIIAGTDYCTYIYWHSGTGLAKSTTYATAAAAGNVLVGYVTTDGTSTILAIYPATVVGPLGIVPNIASSAFTGIVAVANGGTGVATLASHGVLTGATTGNVFTTTAGTTGQVFIGTTGAAPSFSASPTGLTTIGTAAITGLTSSITPTAAGGATVGTAALPFSSLFLGASANSYQFTGTAGQATAVTLQDPGATANLNFLTVMDCGSTSTGTQNCAKTNRPKGIAVYGIVTLPSAATQAITTLPFTGAGTYSCTGSDFTTAAGIISFSAYTSGAQATIRESGGSTTDVIYYSCIGY